MKKNMTKTQKKKRLSVLVGTGIFATLSVILYMIKIPPFIFPIFPPPFNFLEINFSEVPALIASFAYGPLSGFFILVIRFLVKLPISSTLMIGEVADLIYSTSFVVTAGLIYKTNRTFKGTFIALLVAFIFQIAVSSLANYFVIYHLYNNIFFGGNIPFTPGDFIIYVIPFNLVKNTIIAGITLLVYKRLMALIRRLIK